MYKENRQLAETVSNDVYPLKKLHHNGPLPSGMSMCEQYCHYFRTDTVVSCSEGNNCFEIFGTAALIRNILLTHCGNICVVYECFEASESFFTYLLVSTSLGICQVSKLQGQLCVTNIDDVKQKLVILPFRNDFVVMPLYTAAGANQL